MAFCPNCGAPHDAGAKFCAGCGNALAAPNPAPQNPAPQYQAPQFQAPQYPQYQAPQYQAPQYSQYQVPQHQVPQYRPVAQNPQANRSAAKKLAITASVLVIISLVLRIVYFVALAKAYALPPAAFLNARNFISILLKTFVCGIFPCLALYAAAVGNTKMGKGLQVGVGCFLALQVLLAVLCLVSMFLMRFFGMRLYDVVSRIASYIPGANLLSLFNIGNWRFLFIPNLLQVLTSLCCWIVNILTLAAASKLKKS